MVPGNSVFLSSEYSMLGDFLGCIKGVKYLLNFKRERGISLETLQQEIGSSHNDGETS